MADSTRAMRRSIFERELVPHWRNRLLFRCIEKVATPPTVRLGMKFYLLSMVRKSELQVAVWGEVDFENAVWSILTCSPEM